MKPGDIVIVRIESKWADHAGLYMDSPENFKIGQFPTKKLISQNEIGFVVSVSKEKSVFDWLIEVSFPACSLQGWLPIADLETLETL